MPTTDRPIWKRVEETIAHCAEKRAVGLTPTITQREMSDVIERWNALNRAKVPDKRRQVDARLTWCRDTGHLLAVSPLGVICVRCCRWQGSAITAVSVRDEQDEQDERERERERDE